MKEPWEIPKEKNCNYGIHDTRFVCILFLALFLQHFIIKLDIIGTI